jgi:uncharacterized protein YecT (DUF1311 family)
MRRIGLAVVAIQIGLALPAFAENPPDPDRPISQTLPLYGKNHCDAYRDQTEQLFCGDPELNGTGVKLNAAIQDRLSRLANKRLAIEENAEWIRERNSSCGIFRRVTISSENFDAIKSCLLRETEERIEILSDPNFDCLATNTTAGMLICSDPSLAMAKAELNNRALELINKLNGDDARDALDEYERWSRERDRKCALVDKDNVPLDELSGSEGCLAQYMSEKTASLAAAKGDARKVFARRVLSPLPDADAVDLCVAQIHSANSCGSFLAVNRVFRINDEVAEQSARVTAEVEMVVLSPFAVCSPIASNCTGTCWDPKSGKPSPAPGSRDSLPVSHRLKIQKAFAFQKADSGWRCNTTSLQPVDFGVVESGP